MLRWRNPFRSLAMMSDVAKVSLATAVGLLMCSLAAATINLLVGDWFQAGGLAIVGLFYLALFALNHPPHSCTSLGAAEWLKQRGRDRHEDEPH